jgi:hypothetical protein
MSDYEQSNVGLGIIPHKTSCRCDECRVEHLQRELAAKTAGYENAVQSLTHYAGIILSLQKECAELRKDATRAIEAWDVTVLPKGRDGRMQEAMECLRAALGEKP